MIETLVSAVTCVCLWDFSAPFSKNENAFRWPFSKNENGCFCSCSQPLAIAKRPNSPRAPFTLWNEVVILPWPHDLTCVVLGALEELGLKKDFLSYSDPGKHKDIKQKERKFLSVCLEFSQSQQIFPAGMNDCYSILTHKSPDSADKICVSPVLDALAKGYINWTSDGVSSPIMMETRQTQMPFHGVCKH